MAESNRQRKIAGVLQNDIAQVLQQMMTDGGQSGILVSVSKVSVSVDLSVAKVYLSIFPSEHASKLLKEINTHKSQIKHKVAVLTRNQLRKMPDLTFYNDDSLDYIDRIDQAFKGSDDPLKDPSLLAKRKKK
ncbi:30S ribosome-binding factor RbfA [Aureitalea marina]|uniref:Ribosome-binding factor A n=1 Tax=Aureitalea marina TaxID=930804 RepID=A0A2S7KS58_9FLAO|nr:30S ribosome-binding factor RbfA [Aureitalea marina]PQB05437.1 ribosome-binding factor A [Aureitalea marina]